jgi:hypothetical protein
MIRILLTPFRVGGKAVIRFNRNDGGPMAGYIAYTSLLAVFPFLIFASALAGITMGPEETERIILGRVLGLRVVPGRLRPRLQSDGSEAGLGDAGP